MDQLLFNNRSIKAKKWIVVTTISNPTPDIMFLSKIPGWTVVVVGDTNTPNDWRLPNCIFLSLEEQKRFKSESVPLLPTNSYARKNAGYLFAIAHGAEVIYETDDDNRPLDLLQTFVLDSSVWGLLYAGKGLFNPYHHFGQPTLWPRGYPLSSVGENISTEYVLNHWKTPSIQQGVVNGDPDMDAIFRLTRKQTHSQLNVTFDDRAPPAIVPAGVFSPFNSQNTLFLYDALWALLIPTTTTFRVCDIWRGYWAQRLLWEMGGNLGFFPPNAFQKRNSHSYMKDAVDEKDLYFQTERLLEFLRHWRCEPEKSFFTCMEKLSTDMAHDGFWEGPDGKLTARWIKDLRTIGYKEPGRIPYGSHKEGSEFMKELILPNQVRITDKMVNVTFWAAEQIAPLNSFAQSENPKMLSRVSKIASYCKNTSVNWLAIDYAKRTQSYQNILLIVVFGNPFYKNIPFLETMYSMYFPHTVYCGPSKDLFDNHTASLLNPLSFIELEVGGGWFAHNCLIKAIEMHYNVDGYLYIGDDTLLNVWNLHDLPFDKLWLFDATVFQQSVKPNWPWVLNPKVGLNVYQAAINASNVLDKQRYETFTRMLEKNTGKDDGFYGAVSDIAYVPKRYKNDIIYFMNHFSKFDLFVEIIFPTVFGGIEKWENVIKLRGTYLWYGGERDHIEQYFNKSSIFIHPVKLSKEIYSPKGRIFFCETFFPLILSHG